MGLECLRERAREAQDASSGGARSRRLAAGSERTLYKCDTSMPLTFLLHSDENNNSTSLAAKRCVMLSRAAGALTRDVSAWPRGDSLAEPCVVAGAPALDTDELEEFAAPFSRYCKKPTPDMEDGTNGTNGTRGRERWRTRGVRQEEKDRTSVGALFSSRKFDRSIDRSIERECRLPRASESNPLICHLSIPQPVAAGLPSASPSADGLFCGLVFLAPFSHFALPVSGRFRVAAGTK